MKCQKYGVECAWARGDEGDDCALPGISKCVKAEVGPVNEKPFEYHTSDMHVFKCPRSDLSMPIEVFGFSEIQSETELSNLMGAVAEMIAYHRGEVHPRLNGFAGYDTLSWKIVQRVPKGYWELGRNEGIQGWRCRECGAWIGEDDARLCKCDEGEGEG